MRHRHFWRNAARNITTRGLIIRRNTAITFKNTHATAQTANALPVTAVAADSALRPQWQNQQATLATSEHPARRVRA
jgi:hypothetical protein